MGATGPIVVLWLLVAGVPGLVTVRLGARIWKRRTTTPTAVKAATALAVGAAVVGTLGTLFGAAKALSAFVRQDLYLYQRTRTFAEGISAAMNWTAFGLAVWTPAFVAALLLLRRSHRGDRVSS